MNSSDDVNLGDVFRDALSQAPSGNVAVRDPLEALTYARLLETAEPTLDPVHDQLGSHSPLRIGIKAQNSGLTVRCIVGAILRNDIPFLIDPALGAVELESIVKDCNLQALIIDRSDASSTVVREETSRPFGGDTSLDFIILSGLGDGPTPLESTAVCRFTSGSTGRPNCLEFSGRAVCEAAWNWAATTELAEADTTLCYAVLSNGLAFNTSLLATFLRGATLAFDDGLPTASKVERTLKRVAATRLVGFPALYDSFARRGRSMAIDVGLAISSGAPLGDETRRRLEELGLKVSSYYGIAETGPLTFPRGDSKGLGSPLPGVSVRCFGSVERPGELLVKSPSMASRHLNAPGMLESKIDGDGFFHTGDEGYVDDSRNVHLTGRTARYINIGGRKVDPLEVAHVIRRHDDVRDVVVFEGQTVSGAPLVAACVAAANGVTPRAVRDFCRTHLPGFKVPTRIAVVDALPVNGIGKVSLAAVRQLSSREETRHARA